MLYIQTFLFVDSRMSCWLEWMIPYGRHEKENAFSWTYFHPNQSLLKWSILKERSHFLCFVGFVHFASSLPKGGLIIFHLLGWSGVFFIFIFLNFWPGLGQGLHLHLSSNLNYCRDSAGSLTSWATWEFPFLFFIFWCLSLPGEKRCQHHSKQKERSGHGYLSSGEKPESSEEEHWILSPNTGARWGWAGN